VEASQSLRHSYKLAKPVAKPRRKTSSFKSVLLSLLQESQWGDARRRKARRCKRGQG
jgi:hypothetical protein